MTGTPEPNPLLKRYPDDTAWEDCDTLELRRQCIIRDIPSDKTSREHKIHLLQEYHKAHVTEVRKIPWCRPQDMIPLTERYSRWGKASYQVMRVEDKRSSNETTGFRKDFTLCDKNLKGWTCVVAIKEIPTCTCQSQLGQYHCIHVMYILHFVLKCPQKIILQAAFLPSELNAIYRHSYAIRTLLRMDTEIQGNFCVICFQFPIPKGNTHCCKRAMHEDCLRAVVMARKDMDGTGHRCFVCDDLDEWDIEKHDKQEQTPAATTVATVASQPSAPMPSIAQQSVEDKYEHDQETPMLSNEQSDEDIQVNNNPDSEQRPRHPPRVSASVSSSSSNFPTPQFAANQQELLAPPSTHQSSQAPGDVIPHLMGSISLAPIPLQRSTSAPPTAAPTATGEENAGATAAQHTDPASSIESSADSEIDIRDRRSSKLARRFRRLSKELDYVRREAERDIERIYRKRNREIRRLKRKNMELRRQIRELSRFEIEEGNGAAGEGM